MIVDAVRVLIPALASFSIGIVFAPLLAHYLYRSKSWKKQAGKQGLEDKNGTPLFNALHETREVSTPRMGGILIWSAVLGSSLLFIGLADLLGEPFSSLNFITRNQTWLPFSALLVGAIAGLFDDTLEITRGDGGLRLRWRLAIVALLGFFSAWWFYEKLDVSSVGIPFGSPLELGWLFIPFFVFVMLAVYAGGIIDGIDGLAGGVFAFVFMAYAGIAFAQEQTTLAAFSASIAGATLAFLWFNIPPARFYMSETGSMALTVALAITAFSADVLGEGIGVAVLPIIALPLTATVLGNVL